MGIIEHTERELKAAGLHKKDSDYLEVCLI